MKKITEIPYGWREFLHYVMVTGSVFLAHEFTDLTGIEARVIEPGGIFNWAILFSVYMVFIVAVDKYAHAILKLK